MDTSKFDQDIENAKNNITTLEAQLEPAKQKYLESTISAISNWIKRYIDDTVKRDSATTVALGERLKELKIEYEATLKKIPEHVQQILGKHSVWNYTFHLNGTYTDDTQIMNITNRIWQEINRVYKDLHGFAGNILYKYGYKSIASEWTNISSDLPTYKGEIKYNKETGDLFKAYFELFDKVSKAHVQLKKAEIAKSQAEAADLWEQA